MIICKRCKIEKIEKEFKIDNDNLRGYHFKMVKKLEKNLVEVIQYIEI